MYEVRSPSRDKSAQAIDGVFASEASANTYAAMLRHLGNADVVVTPIAWIPCRYCVDGFSDSYEIATDEYIAMRGLALTVKGECAACLGTKRHPEGDDPDADLIADHNPIAGMPPARKTP